MLQSHLPLGVFDSGLGGLTVVRALREHLPHESVVYLGDTARVPYGTRSPQTVIRYAQACARALVGHQIKALVVACGTVSSVALDTLRVDLDIPVMGVIRPSAVLAVELSGGGRIGVLGTPGTIGSGAYPRLVASVSTRAEVMGRAAPLFVPLVEEGWLDGPVPEAVADRYLGPLVEWGAQVVVLGCTHYPLLKPVITRRANALSSEPVAVVDTADAVALALRRLLGERGLENQSRARGTLELLVTDQPSAFEEVAGRFLGDVVQNVTAIDL